MTETTIAPDHDPVKVEAEIRALVQAGTPPSLPLSIEIDVVKHLFEVKDVGILGKAEATVRDLVGLPGRRVLRDHETTATIKFPPGSISEIQIDREVARRMEEFHQAAGRSYTPIARRSANLIVAEHIQQAAMLHHSPNSEHWTDIRVTPENPTLRGFLLEYFEIQPPATAEGDAP